MFPGFHDPYAALLCNEIINFLITVQCPVKFISLKKG
jgi:hypothetical protein